MYVSGRAISLVIHIFEAQVACARKGEGQYHRAYVLKRTLKYVWPVRLDTWQIEATQNS